MSTSENKSTPRLIIVVPVYNESAVLPKTAPTFREYLNQLIKEHRVTDDSMVWYIDDGSTDNTWELITKMTETDPLIAGLHLSKNYGHQAALLAGLLEARHHADAVISLDCDGQDDIHAIGAMLDRYCAGYQIVYGVRAGRASDSWFKRNSAKAFYRTLRWLGVQVIPDHADFRLMSSLVINHLAEFHETNLFLRGLIPLLGFPNTIIYYDRQPRQAGESHYSLRRMCHLALDGITSLSIRPVRLITWFGFLVAALSFIGVVWSVIVYFTGHNIVGWASMTCIICMLGGIQLVAIGVIGEYIGKIYLETKRRPRYIIESQVGKITDIPSTTRKSGDARA